ncbi:hypothetical protein VTN77DRAFT_6026 [Rasamsonia byssochlamydoides]|uniref:uncharacterized protein n=1 Tax=Rasamsonia byssochlamydoides TaxID=89139 RepID=UPI00374343D5
MRVSTSRRDGSKLTRDSAPTKTCGLREGPRRSRLFSNDRRLAVDKLEVLSKSITGTRMGLQSPPFSGNLPCPCSRTTKYPTYSRTALW